MAVAVRDAVMGELKAAGALPAYYRPKPQLLIPMQLSRNPHPLVGREREVQRVVQSLQLHRAAVVWGGPGEGKSSIATEAGCRLWAANECLGGCFSLDLAGMLMLPVFAKDEIKACMYGQPCSRHAGVPKDGGVREFVAGRLVPVLAQCMV